MKFLDWIRRTAKEMNKFLKLDSSNDGFIDAGIITLVFLFMVCSGMFTIITMIRANFLLSIMFIILGVYSEIVCIIAGLIAAEMFMLLIRDPDEEDNYYD